MLDFLAYFHQVLTSDPSLTAIIPSDNIGASLRQSAVPPLLEYGLDANESDPFGHASMDLVVTLYSKAGTEELWMAAQAVHALMTAAKLTPQNASFRTSQVRLLSRRTVPRTDWGDALRCEYAIRFVEADPVNQKQ